MQPTGEELYPPLKSSGITPRQGETKSRVMVACSECRRRRVRCDGMLPCSNCIRRGEASMCRDGIPSTSQAKRDREVLFLRKITQMSHRIGQLEEALAGTQSTLSNETHPLLTDDLLKIKSPGEHLEDEEMPTSQSSNIKRRRNGFEGDEVNVGVIRDVDAAGFQDFDIVNKKQRTAASHPFSRLSTPLQQPQLDVSKSAAVNYSAQPIEHIRGHSQQPILNFPDVTSSLPSAASAWSSMPGLPVRGLEEDRDSDKNKLVEEKRRSTVTCVRCRKLKMKCSYITDPNACERCLHGGHECLIPGQMSSRVPEQSSTSQVRLQADQIKRLIAQMESVSQSPKPMSHMEASPTAVASTSSSTGRRENSPYVVQNTDAERALIEWVAKAKDSFIQFEEAILNNHVSKDTTKLAPNQPSGACSRCKSLKVKCEFRADSATCKRCLNGGHKCVRTKRKLRAAPPKREDLINSIRMQAQQINKLMSMLESNQHLKEASPDPEHSPSLMPDVYDHSRHDSVPVSQGINPRIEEWLSGARQSFLQFENSLPDPDHTENESLHGSDLGGYDYGFSDFGPDTDEDEELQNSPSPEPAAYSSPGTAMTSAMSLGLLSEESLVGARRSTRLPVLHSIGLKESNIRGEKKEGRVRMELPGKTFEKARSAAISYTTVDNPLSLLAFHSRQTRLSAAFGPQVVDLALCNSHSSSTRPYCHSGTRENVLESIRNIEGRSGFVFVRGATGVGKTAIMQTLAKRESEVKRSLATIFYEPKFSEKASNFGRLIFPILAYQLALQDDSYTAHVLEVLDRQSVFGESLQKQFNVLIAGPCARQNTGGTYRKPFLIVLDGLDGRGMDKDLYIEMVQLISRHACTAGQSCISWIITNPPEPLDLPSPLTAMELDIPIDSDDACEDLEKFLCDEFRAISSRFPARTPEQWPSEDDFIRLATAASGYFAFATSIIDFVGDPSVADPVGRLSAAIAYITGRSRDISPFATLDTLYSGRSTELLHRNCPLPCFLPASSSFPLSGFPKLLPLSWLHAIYSACPRVLPVPLCANFRPF